MSNAACKLRAQPIQYDIYIQFIARDALDDGKRSSFIHRHMIERVITARAIPRDNFAGETNVAEC
jgi:hypothetical protein